MAIAKITEADLAGTVRRKLITDGWDCYAEVQMFQNDKRADLVATLGPRLAVIETKLSLSFDVLSQAIRWLGLAHHVIVAVPEPKNIVGSRQEFVEDYLRSKGIGLWWVRGADLEVWGDHDPALIRERVKPVLHRYANGESKKLRAVLVPEMRDAAPGARTGGIASTPFKRTCLELKRYVSSCPGVALNKAIGAIQHHYASEISARGSAELLVRNAGVLLEHGRLWPVDYDRTAVAVEQTEFDPRNHKQPELFA